MNGAQGKVTLILRVSVPSQKGTARPLHGSHDQNIPNRRCWPACRMIWQWRGSALPLCRPVRKKSSPDGDKSVRLYLPADIVYPWDMGFSIADQRTWSMDNRTGKTSSGQCGNRHHGKRAGTDNRS